MSLVFENLTVEFPGVRAVDNVSFSVPQGTIHAIIGENGAGKSTLMKVLAGLYPTGAYEGSFSIGGQVQKFANVQEAELSGVVMIPQDLNLAEDLSIAENMQLNRLPQKHGVIDTVEMYRRADHELRRMGLDISPFVRAGDLGIAEKQMAAIAAAMARNVKILILDEPTATLSGHESEVLFDKIANLSAQGVTCLYISHRLDEVLRISDSVSVLRDGKFVSTNPTKELSEGELVSLMIGRDLQDYYPNNTRTPGKVIFEANSVTVPHPRVPNIHLVEDVSFDLRKGEILGVFGLVGAGRTEMANALVGMDPNAVIKGSHLEGNTLPRFQHPADALKAGIGYLPEDRKTLGVIGESSIANNIVLSNLGAVTKYGFLSNEAIFGTAQRHKDNFRIKSNDLSNLVKNLSGGNQQKVLLSRLIAADLSVVILDEPTQGVDVGAKAEIYQILNELAAGGLAIIMISSDISEVFGMSDRVMVLHQGKRALLDEISNHSQRELLEYATLGRLEKSGENGQH